jgi:hypothetical protein
LFGLDQKASAIGDPWIGCFQVSSRFSVLSSQFLVFSLPVSVMSVDFLEGRVNVRAKGRAVNSVFLVQLRKMFATDFHGWARIVKLVEGVALSCTEGLGSVRESVRREKLRGVWGRIVHRGCTGNAERRRAAISDRWPVISEVSGSLRSLDGRMRPSQRESG